MPVAFAYIGVILIWSTTPLAIQWSSEGVGFLFGVSARMVLGVLLCLLIMALMSIPLPWHRKARHTYLAAGMGIFGAMFCVYWGAQFIPSGLIAVLFGMTPLVTGVMAAILLREQALTPAKLSGMLLGVAGLYLIYQGQVAAQAQAILGIAAILLAVMLHSTSLVLVKRIDASLPAMAVTAGGLLVAVPAYLLSWWLMDASLPQEIPQRAGWSIVYLAAFGSVLGFMLFFYALKRVEAARMALITLITPVLALLLGLSLNDEQIPQVVWAGSALILFGLGLHQFGGRARGFLRLGGTANGGQN